MPTPLDRDDNRAGLKNAGLKNKVVKGGLYLALRQLVIVGLSVLSILVIAKQLGPANYGILVNALGIFYFTTWTGKLGLHQRSQKDATANRLADDQLVTGPQHPFGFWIRQLTAQHGKPRR